MRMILRYLPKELYAEVAKYRGFAEDGSDILEEESDVKTDAENKTEKPAKKWWMFWKK